jgi:hypothetical protein
MMTMTMNLDDGAIGADQRIRCCDRHCRRGQGWSECKGASRKSDQQSLFHLKFPPGTTRIIAVMGKHLRYQDGSMAGGRAACNAQQKAPANRAGAFSF